MVKPKVEVKKVCDWFECESKPLRVGMESVGCCHKHHLKLPIEARRDYLMTQRDSDERIAAAEVIMDFHVKTGNACAHRRIKNQRDCEVCFPPEPKKARSNW